MAETAPAALRLMEEFAADRRQLRSGLKDKLTRFLDLAGSRGLCLEFSNELDTLFIRAEKDPQPAFLEVLTDSLYVALDPDTEEVVGFEVQAFGRSLASNAAANAAFGMLYPALVHYGTLVLPAGSGAPEAAARDLYRALA